MNIHFLFNWYKVTLVFCVKLYLPRFIISSSRLNHFQFNIHCVSKNDTDVAHYNFNAHQPILVIFGRGIAVRDCYRMVIFLSHLF